MYLLQQWPSWGRSTYLLVVSIYRGGKHGHTHTWMKSLNPSTSAKTVLAKLPNLCVALTNIDIFQMTQKLSLFTVDFGVVCVKIFWANFCICTHAECLQMYAVSAPFGLLSKVPQTFSKIKTACSHAPHSWFTYLPSGRHPYHSLFYTTHSLYTIHPPCEKVPFPILHMWLIIIRLAALSFVVGVSHLVNPGSVTALIFYPC